MPNTTISFGRILIIIGVAGYVISMINQQTSITAMIPAAFGIVLLILGYFARMKEGMRKHLMHVAVVIALLGFLAVAGRLISKIGSFEFTAGPLAQLLTAIVFLAYIIIAVRSFISARGQAEA